jgi:hypothetical protein
MADREDAGLVLRNQLEPAAREISRGERCSANTRRTARQSGSTNPDDDRWFQKGCERQMLPGAGIHLFSGETLLR